MSQNVHQLAAHAYGVARRNQTPLRVIVELYDAMLCAVAHAKQAKLEGRPESEFKALERATQVLLGLDGTLNRDEPRTQALVETLHEYYKTTLVQVHRARAAKSPDAELRYASVQRQILTMREAFASVAGVPSLVARQSEKTA